MRKRYILPLLACIIATSCIAAQPSLALSDDVVISQIQAGSALSASNEFVELYNNGLDDTEITNWCIFYASASLVTKGNQVKCFEVVSEYSHLFLPGRTSAFVASNQLVLATPGLGSDLTFAAGMAATAGHVRLLDASGEEVDKVGWGTTAVSAEGARPALAPPTGKVMQRKEMSPGILQDTDVNGDDFELAIPKANYEFGAIREVIDLCHTIDGVQATVPVDYTLDSAGMCVPPPVDVCATIDGVQVTLPVGHAFDQAGECQLDVCLNMTDLQLTVPQGYRLSSTGSCLLDLLPLKITEILANPSGSDIDTEFIELYNPNSVRVDLDSYRIRIGTDTPKNYEFLAASSIEPGGYRAFYSRDIAYTLVNSSQVVAVTSLEGTLIDQSAAYQNPADNSAWALIDGAWQYTDQPTPGSVNVISPVELESELVSEAAVVPCAANQYRNPETGRCRLLSVASSSTLTACKDGQYRSEETNRCRNIVSDAVTLVACNENQERNPETGRCRLISSVLGATLVACKEGQERNPDTNRCRNVTAAMPSAAYPVEPTATQSGGYWGWLALGGAAIAAITYGVWEWRSEIVRASTKVRRFFHLKK